jgi:3',5'-cyclic AMP phosphodiesterase CpdA
MSVFSRRTLLTGGIAAGLSISLGDVAESRPRGPRMRFVFMTDVHIQPELGAVDGTALAVREILKLRPRPQFVLMGGDTVMDALVAKRERVELQFRLFNEALAPLEMPVHYTVGNHDVFGWGRKDADRSDPEYGKRMFEERVARGSCRRAFEAGGWKFLLLDSIHHTEPSGYRGQIDDDQLQWIKDELGRTPPEQPVAFCTHIPLVSLCAQFQRGSTAGAGDDMIVRNAREVNALFRGRNVKLVLQGHSHTVERCEYLGIDYISGGAICGAWWRGPFLGVFREGFGVVDCDGDAFRWSYVPYGWKARSA